LVRPIITAAATSVQPASDVLTVRLGSLSPGRAATAVAELGHYRTATETRYVGTDLVLRYEVDTRPPTTLVL
jgi:hypothetical protein